VGQPVNQEKWAFSNLSLDSEQQLKDLNLLGVDNTESI
jgi:hypothetical protein